MSSYEEALLAAADEAGAAWVQGEQGWVAFGEPRPLRAWSDLDRDGAWFIALPYGFPQEPGRAWDLSAASSYPLAGASMLEPPRALSCSAAWDGEGHRARVRAAQAAIAAGEVYQLNLGCTWRIALAPHPCPDVALHLALRARDPAPYACLLRGGAGPAIVGNSPELFLAVRDGVATMRPIKGTRRRRRGEEAAVRAELAASEKERAELAMIVDLCRHDLGRVAVPGGVRVDDPGSVVDLPHLHHRLAQVSARLRPGTPLSAVIAACFPAGSITGAPKRAAMRHIAALEGASRGHWCGAYGRLAGGGCELAVAIRTVEIAGATLWLRAGGGIVADSDPAQEWQEARDKARAVAEVLGLPWEER
ncbi:MAG: anthranilate synthase component I family protein [Planctomycetota bacterium]|nr:anthranilate synthase component I family protein [Planctomycetota bacterium]MDW8372070.1 anthranilate synthase component I family protein [Planctomycetota bacterium]